MGKIMALFAAAPGRVIDVAGYVVHSPVVAECSFVTLAIVSAAAVLAARAGLRAGRNGG